MNRINRACSRLRISALVVPWCVASGLSLLCAGCGRSVHPEGTGISSVDAGQRVRAIRQAARAGDVDRVAALVDRLEDEDSAVRFAAIIALEKLTGMRLDYDYADDAEQRSRAVEAWRLYLTVRSEAGDTAPAAVPKR